MTMLHCAVFASQYTNESDWFKCQLNNIFRDLSAGEAMGGFYSYLSASTGFLVAAFRSPSKSPQRGDFRSVAINFSFTHSIICSRFSPFGGVRGGFYSYLNASTGFLVAARQLCQLTVSNAIPRANTPESAKIHQLKLVL